MYKQVERPQQLLACAIFCICGGGLYVVYMFVHRTATLILSAVEGGYKRAQLSPYDGSDEENGDEYVVQGSITEETPIVRPKSNDVPMLREDVLAGMYLGGSGTFLALPALCMWDPAATCTLLLGLQFASLWERIKVVL